MLGGIYFGEVYFGQSSPAISAGTITGDGAITFGAMTGSADGAVLVSGAGAAAFGAMTGASAATVLVSGAGAATFGTIAGSSEGAVLVTGSAASTFGAMAGDGAGVVVSTVTGDGAATFDAMTGDASGTVEATEDETTLQPSSPISWPWAPEKAPRKRIRGRGKLKLTPARLDGRGRSRYFHKSDGRGVGMELTISGRATCDTEEIDKALVLMMLEM